MAKAPMVLGGLLGCDKPPTRSEVDDLRYQVTAMSQSISDLEEKISSLESELEEAKSTCEGNACDCPTPGVVYSFPTAKKPKKPRK